MPWHSWIVVGPVADWTSRCVHAPAVSLTRGEPGSMPGMAFNSTPAPRRRSQPPAFGQLAGDRQRMRLSVGDADRDEVETGPSLGIEGGIGPVGHPVGAHAAGERPVGGQHLLHQGLRADRRWMHCWACCCDEGGREQVLAGAPRRLEHGVADPQVLRAVSSVAPRRRRDRGSPARRGSACSGSRRPPTGLGPAAGRSGRGRGGRLAGAGEPPQAASSARPAAAISMGTRFMPAVLRPGG